MNKITLVTGGNRGIGREICRQLALKNHTVLLASRSLDQGETAAAELRHETGGDILAYQLELTNEEDMQRLHDDIDQEFGRLDILINNAGIFPDRTNRLLDLNLDALRQTVDVNVYAPLRLIQVLLPLMRRKDGGRIINMSSAMGELSAVTQGQPAYRLSKVNLNLLTRILAAELENSGITVNAVSPGWVRTDMGGDSAPRSVAEGADTAVWLATLPHEGPHGEFFHDRQPIPW